MNPKFRFFINFVNWPMSIYRFRKKKYLHVYKKFFLLKRCFFALDLFVLDPSLNGVLKCFNMLTTSGPVSTGIDHLCTSVHWYWPPLYQCAMVLTTSGPVCTGFNHFWTSVQWCKISVIYSSCSMLNKNKYFLTIFFQIKCF